MIDTHAEHPLNALEQRLATLVDGLREGYLREQRLTSELDSASRQQESLEQQLVEQQEQLAEVTRERDSLQASSAEQQQHRQTLEHRCEELQRACEELQLEREQLQQRCDERQQSLDELRQRHTEIEHRWQQAQSQLDEAAQQQARFAEAQADAQAQLNEQQQAQQARIGELEAELTQVRDERQQLADHNSELAEENRELDEQNRELEAHNARLRERVEHPEASSSSPTPMFSRSTRRAQGLAALIHHRPRHDQTSGDAEASEGQTPAGGEQQREAAAEEPRPQEEASASTESSVPEAEHSHPSTEAGESLPSNAEGALSPSPETGGDLSSAAEGNLSSGAEGSSTTLDADSRPAVEQGDLPFDKAPSPQSLLADWYQKYDQTFFKGHTRPLKVGIHEDLAAREPWPEKLVRRALACYVNLPRYLKSVREGADRIDLSGGVDGQVDAQAAEYAKRKLDRLQAERQQQGRRNKPARRGTGGKASAAGNKASASSREPEASPPAAGGAVRDAQSTSSPSPSAEAEPRGQREGGQREDSREGRLQRKLDALMARHNAN
ncbi:hypothetical protein HCU01_12330 [Halomonas cupida]|uniref:ProQ/FINO family protein n=1 Tax=Halomonas cupida TaxID=44933 RepID=A0A1M7EVZ6_9GAMM|nr:ProQ/FINO family protein [Halomonas cupida]GEN23284.1 hypothetical protein HCU01_12330 [Halomonas cupida]SHL95861.1 ProQ/FINO family protein [Halomonas cupida]